MDLFGYCIIFDSSSAFYKYLKYVNKNGFFLQKYFSFFMRNSKNYLFIRLYSYVHFWTDVLSLINVNYQCLCKKLLFTYSTLDMVFVKLNKNWIKQNNLQIKWNICELWQPTDEIIEGKLWNCNRKNILLYKQIQFMFLSLYIVFIRRWKYEAKNKITNIVSKSMSFYLCSDVVCWNKICLFHLNLLCNGAANQ